MLDGPKNDSDIFFQTSYLKCIFRPEFIRIWRFVQHECCRSFFSDRFSYIICQIWLLDDRNLIKILYYVQCTQSTPTSCNILLTDLHTVSHLGVFIKLVDLPLGYNISKFQSKIIFGSRDMAQTIELAESTNWIFR